MFALASLPSVGAWAVFYLFGRPRALGPRPLTPTPQRRAAAGYRVASITAALAAALRCRSER